MASLLALGLVSANTASYFGNACLCHYEAFHIDYGAMLDRLSLAPSSRLHRWLLFWASGAPARRPGWSFRLFNLTRFLQRPSVPVFSLFRCLSHPPGRCSAAAWLRLPARGDMRKSVPPAHAPQWRQTLHPARMVSSSINPAHQARGPAVAE